MLKKEVGNAQSVNDASQAEWAKRVRELLNYDPETGIIRWRVDRYCWGGRRRHIEAGQIAGTLSKQNGYRFINIDNRPHPAHRLAWVWMRGEYPQADIDHLNGRRDDNRWSNLRDASRLINLQNIRRPKANKKHGNLLGTAWHAKSKAWRALIKVDGRQKCLGYFKTEPDAHKAYIEAKRLLHEGCTI